MNRIVPLIIAVLVLSTVSCATARSTGGISSEPSVSSHLAPFKDVAVEIGRAQLRMGLERRLLKDGVTPEETAKVLAELRSVADEYLRSKDLSGILTDPVRWATVRSELVPRLTRIVILGAVSSGVPAYAQPAAEALVGALLDTFAALLKTQWATDERPSGWQHSYLQAERPARAAIFRTNRG